MLQTQALQLNDFSGGITDYPFDAQPNQGEECDNLLIDPNKKLVLRLGSEFIASGFEQIPEGQARISNIIPMDEEDIYYITTGNKVFYPTTTGFAELTTIGGYAALNAGTANNYTSYSIWNKHLYLCNDAYAQPIKIYKNELGVPTLRTAGLPVPSSTITKTQTTAGALSYIYSVVFRNDYFVGTVKYSDYSEPFDVQFTNIGAISGGNPVNLANLPILPNTTGLSYDYVNAKVEIYRTVAGGLVAYYVGEVANGVTTYSDAKTDAQASVGAIIYNAGGTLEYGQPPKAKYIHVMNGRGYYLNISEGGVLYPNRLYQSIQDDIDSVPREFFLDFRDSCSGISSFNDNVVVFGDSKVYRVNGYYDELGRNGMTYEEISKVTGCISGNSIVQTEFGIFFAGASGFFYTDGFKVRKVSDSMNERYKAIISAGSGSKIHGTFDPIDMKIHWCVKQNSSSADNDKVYTLDLRFAFSKESSMTVQIQSSSFTSWSGENFNPSCLAFYKSRLFRGDYRGLIFEHKEALTTDLKIDFTIPFSAWGVRQIIWDYKTAHLNFGVPEVRKWVSKVLLTSRRISQSSIQLYSINDDTSTQSMMTPIRFREDFIWGDPFFVWGNDACTWSSFGLIEQMRRFPAGGLRCSYKQLRVTNAVVPILNSDDYGLVSLNKSTLSVTLDSGVFDWPDEISDYKIAFTIASNPALEPLAVFEINEKVSANVITIIDNSDVLNNALSAIDFTSVKFVVSGIPKGESFNLMGLQFYFAPITPTQKGFYNTTAETGNNA